MTRARFLTGILAILLVAGSGPLRAEEDAQKRAEVEKSAAEYRRKMEEFQSRTVSPPAASASPIKPPLSNGWRATDDAPLEVKNWVTSLPALKEGLLRELGETLKLQTAGKKKPETTNLAALMSAIRSDPRFLAWPQQLARRVGAFGTVHGLGVFQVLDATTFLASDGGALLMVRGTPTAKLVDGKPLGSCVLRITGTQKYATANNASNTVFVAEYIDLDRYLEGEQYNTFPKHSLQLPWPGYFPPSKL